MRIYTALALAIFALALTLVSANQAETEYFSDGGDLVAYYVYRVHNQVQMLANDNAASPGGEIGFLANEFQYQNGLISRDCVVMLNESFTQYQCCNGGSCGDCDYDGSGSGTNPNMPGRSYQLYPPPGAPASCNVGDACPGVPGVRCGGDCSGWWYSFQSQGNCASGDTPSATGCTWYNSPVVQVIQFNKLLNSGAFYTCEQSAQNPPGGCNGNLGWQQLMTGVQTMLNMFDHQAVSMVLDTSTLTFSNTTVPVQADPAHMCKAPCPPGSSSYSGYMTADHHCKWCPVNTYASSSASTSCTPCPNGGTTTTGGAVSASQCSGGDGDGDANNNNDADGDSDAQAFMESNNSGSSDVQASSMSASEIALFVAGVALIVVVGALIAVAIRRQRAAKKSAELYYHI